jgi:hypothetical protein
MQHELLTLLPRRFTRLEKERRPRSYVRGGSFRPGSINDGKSKVCGGQNWIWVSHNNGGGAQVITTTLEIWVLVRIGKAVTSTQTIRHQTLGL